jgi:hypothetical protein
MFTGVPLVVVAVVTTVVVVHIKKPVVVVVALTKTQPNLQLHRRLRK